MTLSIDHFLQDLKSEGTLDSSGRFSVDYNKQKEKLTRFLLEKTEHLLLKLVQAGVAAGASRLDFDSKATQITFTMYGAQFSFPALGTVLQYLMEDQEAEPGLRSLAVAVNTAVSTRPSAIALACWNGKEGQIVRWSSKGREITPWRPPKVAQPVTTFQLVRTESEYKFNIWHLLSQRDILAMLLGTKKGWDPDRLLLHDFACWCPVPIYMNGRLMEEVPLLVGRDRATLAETPVKHKAEHRIPASPGCRGIRCTTRALRPWPPDQTFPSGPIGAVITASKKENWLQLPSSIEFVLDGVTVGRQAISGTPDNCFVRIVADASMCQTDLNGLNLVYAHETTRQLTQNVLEQAAELFLRTTPRLAEYSPRLRLTRE